MNKYSLFDKLSNTLHPSVCGVDRLSSNVRIISSLFVILLVFVVTTVLVKVDVSDRRVEFFAGTLASVAVISGASNLFYGSVFGISGKFPMRISQALISGNVLHVAGSLHCIIKHLCSNQCENMSSQVRLWEAP